MTRDYNKVKSEMLGKSYQAAMVHVRRRLLFKCLQKCGDNVCHRCGETIETDEELSIDHKIPWMYSENAKELFEDLDNIAFSHRSCNYAHRRQNVSRFGVSGLKGVFQVKRKRGPDKFQALLSIKGKQKYLGQFDTAKEAAQMFDRESLKVFGERAVTNQSLGLI